MTRRIILGLLAVFLLGSLLGLGRQQPERVAVTILATSDLHGYLLPFDYYGNQPADRGLAKSRVAIENALFGGDHA